MNDLKITGGESQPQERTLQVITGEIRLIHKQTQQVVLSAAIEIGRRLVEAKAMVPHGGWGEYLKNEVEYSQSTAQNFIRIFEGLGASQQSLFGGEANSQTFGNLTYTKALELLVLPENEREEFAAEHDLEAMSTRELREAIRQREQAEAEKEAALAEQKAISEANQKMAEDMRLANERLSELSARLEEKERAEQERATQMDSERARLEELEGTHAALEQELEELRARPIEVVGTAVPDEAALAAARKEGELALKAKLDKAKKDRDAAKETVARLEQEKQQAEEATRLAQEQHRTALEAASQERQTMERQVSALEKRIELVGNREMTAFQYYFDVVQSDFDHLLDAYDKLSATGQREECGKLSTALMALLESLTTQMEERRENEV